MSLEKMHKEFEQWGDTHWKKSDWNHVPAKEVFSALGAWKHQQKTIDALKDTTNKQSKEIVNLLAKVERLKAEADRLRIDAGRWDHCMQYGIPVLLSTGWWAWLSNGARVTVKGGGSSDAVDAAMKAQRDLA